MADTKEEVAANPKVLEAVVSLAPRMTLGDVLLRTTAVDPRSLRSQLVSLVVQTGGHLEAAREGEVVYVYPRSPQIVLQRRSARERRRAFYGRVYRLSVSAVRITFGVFLIGSIILAVAAITVVIIIALSERRNGNGGGPLLPVHTGGGGGGGGGGGDGGGPFHPRFLYGTSSWQDMWLMMYMMENHELRRRQMIIQEMDPAFADPVKPASGPAGSFPGYPGHPGYPAQGNGNGHNNNGNDPGNPRGPGGVPVPIVADINATAAEPEPEMSFFEAVFAFVFGRGDANADLEARRWRAVGLALRHFKGAVFAEQIAPFLDSWLLKEDTEERPSRLAKLWAKVVGRIGFHAVRRDSVADTSRMHEGYMLEVLQRFGGHAESSDDGRLIYVFPHLQTTAQPAAAAASASGEQAAGESSGRDAAQPDASSSSSSAGPSAAPLPVPDPRAAPPVPPPVYEKMQALSEGGSKQALVIALGLINVILLLVFRRIGGLKFGEGKSAMEILESDRQIGPLLLLLSYVPALLAWVFKPLLAYAAFFFAVPGVRLVLRVFENRRIAERNVKRRARALEGLRLCSEAREAKARQAEQRQQFEVVVEGRQLDELTSKRAL